jgi:N-acetylmuramoyl-L-alanine amidase
MALNKSDLNTVLKSETRKITVTETTYGDTSVKAVEEKFTKTASKIGGIDGQVLGGVKSLGESGISPNEVLKDGVGQITDNLPGITGKASPAAALSSLAGLPAMVQSGGDTASASMAAVGGGTPEDIQSAVDKVTTISGESMTDISTFTASIASAGELSSITAALPDIKIPSISDVVKDITPVSSLSGIASDAKDAVSDATGIGGLTAKLDDPKNTLSKFGSVGALAKTVFNDVTSVVNKFTTDANNFISDFNTRTETGLSGVLQNLAENLTGDAGAFIQNLVPGGISATERERQAILAQFASNDPVEKTKAVKTLTVKSPNISDRMKGVVEKVQEEKKPTSPTELNNAVVNEATKQGVPESEITECTNEIITIDDGLSKLDTTISGSVVVDSSLFDEGIPVDANNQRWKGRNSENDVFTYVASVEELDAEFNSIKRDITEVIVHATETFTDKDLGAIEINNIHNELGHDGIGYHYVIRRDGRLQRGRPVNRNGEHAVVNGHDVYSIGIVMVGGLNVSSGDDNPTDYRSSQSFTREQYTTLEKFLRSFYRKYPGGQVFGHNDIDEVELDPYFDVVDYVESVFRKSNVTTDPANTSPLSPAEINLDN